jgi:serine/threonine protein kinase
MNVCNCPDQTTLHSYLVGSLATDDDTAVEEHLDACAACRDAVDALDVEANGVFACLREPLDAPTEDQALRGLMRQAMALAGCDGAASTAELPRDLGNYTLLELLGAGGMGQVFRAEHRPMKRMVALKVLSPHLVRSPAAQARFRREISAMARLSSPYIVTAFDGGEAAGRQYLAMEYVAGQTLADRVRQHGPLPVDLALDCVIQAARGLQHAHEAGIIHRDVKPSNLLLAADGQSPKVKLLDLGLAGLREEGNVADLTGNDTPMGTTHFMAPEQAANPHEADERADIYGMGCTLFYFAHRPTALRRNHGHANPARTPR